MSQVPNNEYLPQWLEHRSPNFVLRFLTDSAAERDLGAIVSRLGIIRGKVVEALALRDVPDTQAHVYLSDVPKEEHFPDQRWDGWVSENGVGHIHAIYT